MNNVLDMPVAHETTCGMLLNEMGEKLGCYFTLEYRDVVTPGGVIAVKGLVPNDHSAATIPAFMDQLRADLKDYQVEQDTRNPKIIHIIERALEQQPDYVLDKKVTIKYSGNLEGCIIKDEQGKNITKGEGLVTAIAKIIPGLQGGRGYGGDFTDIVSDCVTEVSVDVTNRPIRSVITDCIPLESYKRILWRAITCKLIKSDTIGVAVEFYGPKISDPDAIIDPKTGFLRLK